MIQRVSADNPEKNTHSEKRAAAGAAVVFGNASIDADLAAVIEAWAELPGSVKAAIVALVKAANVSA